MERNTPNGYAPRILELPSDSRPRERLIADGADALSNAELLAIILRVGGQGENAIAMAHRLLVHFGGLVGLARANVEELCAAKGVGEAKAAQLKAAMEFGRRMHLAAPEERPRINTPADVATLLMMEMGLLEREEMRVALLDTKNYLMKFATVYQGSLNSAVVRTAEVFREPVRANCLSVVLVHNHPSGDPTPSPEDIQVTEQLVAAGRLLDIEVLDHIVIGRNRFVSMKERKLGFR